MRILASERTKVAVAWWADKLVSCKQSGLSAEERRDPANDGYQFAEMLMVTTKPKVTPGQVEAFRESLTAIIEEKQPRILATDYWPDGILQDALNAAKIPIETGTLPIKTRMWIEENSVKVRYGYGADEQTLWRAAPPTEGRQ